MHEISYLGFSRSSIKVSYEHRQCVFNYFAPRECAEMKCSDGNAVFTTILINKYLVLGNVRMKFLVTEFHGKND